MIPLFTSDYSIGRSILKINPVDAEDGPDDISTIAKENGFKEIYIVEDNMIGFLETYKAFHETDIILHYGVRFPICNDVTDENDDSEHKVVIFARNTDGCKMLFNLFSLVSCKHNGKLDYNLLKDNWDDNLLLLAHPHYDSFLYHNTFYFKNCLPQKISDNEIYFLENNNLPQDLIIYSKLVNDNKIVPVVAKSIFYKYRTDFPAYQTYRMACGRKVGRRAPTLSAPNINHFGSDSFCFESYLEQNGRLT